ncbi:hypothetical protein [uncultured Streptomyces sp.]|uniref:hypothetical protein n=1 Tax=uncultured Streptomyces sp. TaxID=174707 RepID=UPI00261BAAC7|nr:hypothetical protein [uncultured Streptomyces sp.]
MVQRAEKDTEPEERRIDLNLPQVAGSALAAVAAAVAASQLGVYGTIVGAGVMSIVATCGSSVFQHFFRRTGEQIREVTVQVTHPTGRQVSVRTRETTREPWPPDDRCTAGPREPDPYGASGAAFAGNDATRPVPAPGAATGPVTWGVPVNDTDGTRLLGAVPGGDADRTQLLGTVPEDDDATRMLRAAPETDPERTRMLRAVPVNEADSTMLLRQADAAGVPAQDAPQDDDWSDGTTHAVRRGWKRPVLAAVVVFVVAMVGITAFEMISGSDLSGGRGTTVGSVVRGGSGGSGSTDPSPATSTGGDERGDEQGDERQSPDTGTSATPGTGTASPTPEGGAGTDATDAPTTAPSGADGGASQAPTPTPSATDGGTATAPAETGDDGSGENGENGEQPGTGADGE